MVNDALLDALFKERDVPSQQELLGHDLVTGRTAWKKVGLALGGRIGKEAKTRKTLIAHPLHVREQDLVVDLCAQVHWVEELNGVEECQVDVAAIWCRAVGTVLVCMQREEADLLSIRGFLERVDRAIGVRELALAVPKLN